jgi:hypothetical protein
MEAVVAVERAADLGGLVGVAVLRPATHHLLQAGDVGVGQHVGDASRIVTAVRTDAIVDVVVANSKLRPRRLVYIAARPIVPR